MSQKPIFQRACLVGLGLIGASLAKAMARAGVAAEIVGADASAHVREEAEALRLCTTVYADARDAARGADLIVLCTPVGTFKGLCADLTDIVSPGAIISDVGSVKAPMVEASALLPPTVHVIPAHPVAGTEKSGPAAGFAELFDGRWCILTPPDGADASKVAALKALWEACGAQVDTMSVERHDLVLAITSHIPHLIAYNIVGTAADLETVTQGEVIKYSAGGFRDFTRIAASDPVMWRDIFIANKDAVLEMLGRFSEDLSALQRAIRWDDADALEQLFSRTRTIRKGIIDAGQN